MAPYPVALYSCNTSPLFFFSSKSFSLLHSLLLPPHPSSSSSLLTPGLHSSSSLLSSQSAGPFSCCPPRVSTAPVEYATPFPGFDFGHELNRLRALRSRLSSASSLGEKHRVIDADPRVSHFFHSGSAGLLARASGPLGFDSYELFLLKCLVAGGQEHVLGTWEGEVESVRSSVKAALYALVEMIERLDVNGAEGVGKRKIGGCLEDEEVQDLKKLLKTLREMEEFYDCIGGIIGYQIMVLELLNESTLESRTTHWPQHALASIESEFVEIHSPSGIDLSRNTGYASQAALWGIEGLPDLGEIYPLGGSADRLGLVDPDTGECLPAAMLPYCGRTLLEGLIRDLQAREFLYYKLYGRQCITPVAIMTSSAKNNHERITSLCEKLQWFGRGQSSFQLFEQPLVPAVCAEDGQWMVWKPFMPVCKPGGHGVIWKLAYDKGVFQWFYDHGRKGATVRQVSNVVAATDVTLLALAGIGLRHRKAEFPANTNILYVDLPSVELVASCKDESSLPGMVLNIKKPIVYMDQFGNRHSVTGGRLECTMQNIADKFANTYSSRCYKAIEDDLDTFIVCNERRRVTSSAKKKRKHSDKSLHQTPEGSLLDIMRNAHDILSQCDIKLPEIEGNDKYLDSGPPFLILLHPALGPLWEVIRQKFSGGSISKGSELKVDVAEFLWRDVELDGSLIIEADNAMGSTKLDDSGEPILKYGLRCGRCKLQNVKVLNDGIDWKFRGNIYWKHDVRRFESLKVKLHGNAEFEANDVTIQGNHVFEVPDGHKLTITAAPAGFDAQLIPIAPNLMDTGSWHWNYMIIGTNIQLELVGS
ncbi:UTP--glucose-1-phosphate uridylyltransferase 3, chloroplastic isoform X2 [Punica granatum]|uniref:UTP--glucose-1-phosphate uridylyltransferase 3, chloroplastic isoform X2 n=1 Tax=Punica granatum TaxID=22663 RepID=A0A6P8BS07_PUNGR|nr:UTP--glucose-1-phosphate uridylyltransferase 3, chloroplastic isoform X2 [Punica granatum]